MRYKTLIKKASLIAFIFISTIVQGCGYSDAKSGNKTQIAAVGSNNLPSISNEHPNKPLVVLTAPADDAVAQSINSGISATFNMPMNPSSISKDSFMVKNAQGVAIAGSIALDNSSYIATFTPAEPLACDTEYFATINTQAQCLPINGEVQALNNNFTWNFTTDCCACEPLLSPYPWLGPDVFLGGFGGFGGGSGGGHRKHKPVRKHVPPTVIATIPLCGAIDVPVNQANISVSFSEAMDPSTINETTFLLLGPGSIRVAGSVSYDVLTHIATFTPNSVLSPNTIYFISIEGPPDGVTDLAGNHLATDFECDFETGALPDTTPPQIIANPTCGTLNVPFNQAISVSFSEAMDPLSINNTTILLTGPGTTPVPGVVTYNLTSFIATFTPSSILIPNTTYTFTVKGAPNGVKDVAGNYLVDDAVCNFSTGPVPDTTPPTVLAQNPLCGVTSVPTNQLITVTFSEAMDPNTISDLTFTLVGPGNTPVAGTVAYNLTSHVATFTPANPLSFNTLYTFTVIGGPNGVADIAGNHLVNDFSCSFTTGSAPDTTPPTVVSNPICGATGVLLTQSLSITFSEALDPASVSILTILLKDSLLNPVAGTVSLDITGTVVTFTPNNPLNPSTTYTLTLVGGANGIKDLAGNPLAANVACSFTTGTASGQSPVDLGRASGFVILAQATITNSGSDTHIIGDVGLDPGTSITGLPPSQVDGTIHINDTAVANAQADFVTAYNTTAGLTVDQQSLPGQLAGLTITPGLYNNASSVLISGDVTLDAQGDSNAVFIFQIGSTLTTGVGSHVLLAGGAKASNIFWQVGSSATLNSGSIFNGTILANTSISTGSGTVVTGRLFSAAIAPSGAVTLISTDVTLPTP